MRTLGATAAILLLIVLACKPTGYNPQSTEYDDEGADHATATKAADEDKVTAADVGEALDDALETAKGYTFTQRAKLSDWARHQADEASARMDQIEQRMQQAGDDAHSQWQEAKAQLKDQIADLEHQAEDLQQASKDKFSEAKESLLASADAIDQRLHEWLESEPRDHSEGA